MTAIRHRKSDRLMTPGASAAEIAADYATAPFDRAMREAEATWGIDRLPGLVAPDLAAKFGLEVGKMNEAIGAGNATRAAELAASCCRGIGVMDAAARAAGHAPLTAEAWEITIDGRTYAILKDVAHWPAYAGQRPGVKFFSLREAVICLLTTETPAVATAKALWPGTEITAVRKTTPLEAELDDEIPF